MSTNDERAIQMGPGGGSAPQAPPRTAGERLAAALPQSVLSLRVADPAPVGITIDDEFYRIRFGDQFTLTQHERLARLHKRGEELQAIGTGEDMESLTPEQEDALNEALDDAYRQMVCLYLPMLPVELAEQLSYLQSQQVVAAVFTQAAARQARQETRAVAAPRSRGARSAARSSAGTATGATGRTRRRSGSSPTPTATSPA